MTQSIIKSIVAGTIFVTGSLFTNVVFAQNSSVFKAETYTEKGDYVKALENIREASYNEKTKDKPRTWYSRANLFITIFEASSTNPEVEKLVQNPIDSAFASMQKVKELEKNEKNKKYTSQIEDPVFQSELGMETGLKARLKNGLFAEVVKYQETDFKKAYELMIPIVTYLPVDTTNLIYIGYFANKAEMFDKAAMYYEKLGDMEEYKSGLEAYQSAAYSYYKLEDSVNFLKILEKGNKRYPQEIYFLTTIADIHIQNKDYKKAIELLKQVNEIKPSTKNLTNIALMYQSEEQPEKAVEYYKKVLELDPQDYDATFALAIHYYRQAANEYNTLKGNEQDPTSLKMKPIIENAEKAISYAQKAIEINKEDVALYSMLKDLYTMKDDTKNVELMKKKIEENK